MEQIFHSLHPQPGEQPGRLVTDSFQRCNRPFSDTRHYVFKILIFHQFNLLQFINFCKEKSRGKPPLFSLVCLCVTDIPIPPKSYSSRSAVRRYEARSHSRKMPPVLFHRTLRPRSPSHLLHSRWKSVRIHHLPWPGVF